MLAAPGGWNGFAIEVADLDLVVVDSAASDWIGAGPGLVGPAVR
jgi:hypothetical protein